MKFFNLEAATENGSKVLNISLFGEIDSDFFVDGVASADIAAQLGAHADATKINVKINSVGGDLFGGLAIYNLLRDHGAEVTTIVEGLAASAASIVAMAGDKIVMGQGAMMMVHNPMTITVGNADDHREQASVLDKARDSLLAVYQAKTGKKSAELRKMLDAETWFSAEDAKREGFADEIAGKTVKVKNRAGGSSVLLNSIAFSRAAVPAPILAMARPKATTDEHEPKEPGHEPDPAPDNEKPVEDPAPSTEPAPIVAAATNVITAAVLSDAVAKAHAAGVSAERARLLAIDELPVRGHAQLIIDAKYGAEPKTAEQVALLAWKAEQGIGNDRITARRAESGEAAGVRQSAPEQVDAAAKNANDERLVRAIVGKSNSNNPIGGV